jgi:hypothetical protein
LSPHKRAYRHQLSESSASARYRADHWRGHTRPTPAPKPRTFGQIRRKLAQLGNQWDRHRRYQAARFATVIEADRLLWETEEEMLQHQVMAELGIVAQPQ